LLCGCEQLIHALGSMAISRMNDDSSTGIRVGERVVVVELFVPNRIGHSIESIALDVVGLARDG
jgi:hypothetical protein